MATKALVIASILSEYALEIEDLELFKAINYKKSALFYPDYATSKARCTIVHQKANANATGMLARGYMITQGDIDDLQTAINTFTDSEGKPGAAESTINVATLTIEQEIDNLKAAWKSIKNLLGTYSTDTATIGIYNTIIDSFEINSSATRHRAVRIIVADEVTKLRLSNATVTITELALQESTSKNGIADFQQADVPQGNYIITVEHPLYSKQTFENVGIASNRQLTLTVELVKTGIGAGTLPLRATSIGELAAGESGEPAELVGENLQPLNGNTEAVIKSTDISGADVKFILLFLSSIDGSRVGRTRTVFFAGQTLTRRTLASMGFVAGQFDVAVLINEGGETGHYRIDLYF